MRRIGAAGLEAGEAVMETSSGEESEACLVAVVRPWGSARWAFASSQLPCLILPALEFLRTYPVLKKKSLSFRYMFA